MVVLVLWCGENVVNRHGDVKMQCRNLFLCET